MGMSQVA
ncbi:macB-like periplasmic core domain protein, partial [Vibrio parahaemolyticus V-223/04]